MFDEIDDFFALDNDATRVKNDAGVGTVAPPNPLVLIAAMRILTMEVNSRGFGFMFGELVKHDPALANALLDVLQMAHDEDPSRGLLGF